MIRVITYGTYDLLHKGHIRLLERAKELGDYLIVGVTADNFDRSRGKINVQQTLAERIEAVKATGLADEIVVEEYEGQKIDDIRRYGVDIFTVGSDWKGHFDYLNEYCKVVYLERTQGISSSELRADKCGIRLGLVGESPILNKIVNESRIVNGIDISGIFSETTKFLSEKLDVVNVSSFKELLDNSDAIYIISNPQRHYCQIKEALLLGKHVLCESPICIKQVEWVELQKNAAAQSCVLMDSIKTAYSTAYYRLLLLAKSGQIGKVVSVEATCTSLDYLQKADSDDIKYIWNSINAWGPTALLPIFQLLGTEYLSKTIISHPLNNKSDFDAFTKINFIYPEAVASMIVGQGVKSEGNLIISGTKGYIYVPAPWWKTDYFELRFENPAENKRYFYQLDGEGIRYELVSFVKSIRTKENYFYVSKDVSQAIVGVIEDFNSRKEFIQI